MNTSDYLPYIESCQQKDCRDPLKNDKVSEYLSGLEQYFGSNTGTDVTSKQIASYLKTGIHKGGEIVFWSEKSLIKYTLWDRLKKVFSFELRRFNWLDITPTYIPIYGSGKTKKKPDSKIKNAFGEIRYYHKAEMDAFKKQEQEDTVTLGDGSTFNIRDTYKLNKNDLFYCKQTYFHRLQTLWRGICRDFLWVPPQFKQYLDNKSRINWFRDNIGKYFFSYGQEQKQVKDGLLERGYNVEENHVYFDHDPSIRRN